MDQAAVDHRRTQARFAVKRKIGIVYSETPASLAKKKKRRKAGELDWLVFMRHGCVIVGRCAVGDRGSQEPRYLT